MKAHPTFWELQMGHGSATFDVYMNYVQDAMHQVFLGVAARLADLWFNTIDMYRLLVSSMLS